MASQQYWVPWFTDLTNTFLGLKVRKQLILAGSDRMDKELTIAHMQGKLNMKVIYDVGHVIQEDKPGEVADAIY